MEIDPQRIRGRSSVGALRSPRVNLVRTQSLEPGTVPSAEGGRARVGMSSHHPRRPLLGVEGSIRMQDGYRRCCGIDVHKNSVMVCVLPPVGQSQIAAKKRKFRTFTRDLKQLRAWLKNCRVTDIAMESTGQYWRPLWNVLEGEFSRLLLVNPQHIKGLNGYKTDPKDAQWIADLLEGGKLRGDRKSTRLNSSHIPLSRMPSS